MFSIYDHVRTLRVHVAITSLDEMENHGLSLGISNGHSRNDTQAFSIIERLPGHFPVSQCESTVSNGKQNEKVPVEITFAKAIFQVEQIFALELSLYWMIR